MDLMYILFLVLGFLFGAFGTLVGAGGGFILMPVLLLMYPKENPEILTAISLAVVFFNASSGSYAYSKLKKIDFRSGLIFAASAVPGSVLGSLTVQFINRNIFNLIFGALLIVVSVYLFFRKQAQKTKEEVPGHYVTRKITDRDEVEYVYSFNGKTGILISAGVGYISSLLGIGGGIIHVPAMVNILNFPVHIATATSHFILAIIALTGTIVHIIEGSFSRDSMFITLFLSAGVIIGAQVGAKYSKKIRGSMIIKILAIALCFVGIRILILSL
jgi:uncharacterized protein